MPPGSSRRYGDQRAVDGDRPRGPPRRGVRRPRPQRRGQDDDAEHARDPAPRRRGPGRGLRPRRRTPSPTPYDGCSASPGSSPRSTRTSPPPRTSGSSRGSRASGAPRPATRGAELLEQFDLTEAATEADLRLLRRHAPASRPRREPAHPATADLPRRADHRASTRAPAGRCGTPSATWSRDGQHGPAHHAVPRRGRPARRPDRRDRPRPQGRRGHRRRAEVVGRPVRRCSSSSADVADLAGERGRRPSGCWARRRS